MVAKSTAELEDSRQGPASIASRCVPAFFAEAAQVDKPGGFPAQSIELLRTSGLLAAPLRPEHGGADLGSPARLLELLRVLAHLGRGSLPVGRLYEGHVNALVLIHAYGSNEAIRRWDGDALAGHLFGVWNTEARDGVQLVASGRSQFTLHGSKTFASGAGHLGRAVVTATNADGQKQMLVIDGDRLESRIDRSFWQPLGMLPSASFKVDLTGIAVTSADLVGNPGDYFRDPLFGAGAMRFAAVQLGGAEAVFDAARHFLRLLRYDGDPHQRMRMGEMAVTIAGACHWLAAAARQVSVEATNERQTETENRAAGKAPADAVVHPNVVFAHMMRSAIEEACLRVLRLAERSVGARGLLHPEPFERLHRDLTHYLRQAGPDAALVAAGANVLARDIAAPHLWGE